MTRSYWNPTPVAQPVPVSPDLILDTTAPAGYHERAKREMYVQLLAGTVLSPLWAPGTAIVGTYQVMTDGPPVGMEGLGTMMLGGLASTAAVGLLAWKGTREQQLAYGGASLASLAYMYWWSRRRETQRQEEFQAMQAQRGFTGARVS